MYGKIVDVGAGMYAFEQLDVLLAAEGALASGRNQVIAVQRFDLRCAFPEPLNELLSYLGVVAEAARFVAYLPGKYRRVVPVRLSGDGVGSADYVAEVAGKKPFCFLVGNECGNCLSISRISYLGRYRGLARSGPLEIHSVASGPFPGVVYVQHGLHFPRRHLVKQVVKSAEQSVVVNQR